MQLQEVLKKINVQPPKLKILHFFFKVIMGGFNKLYYLMC